MDEPTSADTVQEGQDPIYKNWKPEHGQFVVWAIVVILSLYCAYRFYISFHQHPKLPEGIPVVLGTVSQQDVPVYLKALGSVTPTYNVTVKTQLNGTLMQVLYREGQMVKAGDKLAQIDPRPYEAQLMEYEGQLIRDQALLDNARIDLKRYQTLWKQDSISQQTLATQIALVRQYEGAVQLDKGLIQTTKVNLIYCSITAPVDGRIGLRLVDPGNYVQTSDTNGIAVITTLDPITVIFTITEDSIQDVLPKLYSGGEFAVEAFDRQQSKQLGNGRLITMDNQVDPSTGMVRLRAQFPNAKNLLFPSQFVNVKLLVKTLTDAVVIPTAAIQYQEKKSFVYLLNDDKKKPAVKVTTITTSITTDDSTVVTSGLKPGQSVVVEGADRLVDGSLVTVSKGKPAA